MGLFSSTGPQPSARFGAKSPLARDASGGLDNPFERARFATTPLAIGLAPRPAITANRFTSAHASASFSSRPLAPDAPTPAVPLASLLAEAQEDATWRVEPENKTSKEAAEQELTLYRLAIDGSNLTYEQAYTILALTVEFFHRGDHVERVEQIALRTAAGVLLRLQTQIQGETLRILAPFYLEQLRNIFQAWHLYRELVKAIDSRSDFLVRMGGKNDRLIVDSLFSEEGRSMLAARVDGLMQACTRLQLDSEAIKRAEWIGKLLMYRTDDDRWQVPAEACHGLCTRLLREINDDSVMGALRRLALASWEGLCKESNYLRDIFTATTAEDRAVGVILIRSTVPAVGIQMRNDEQVLYFPDHNSFRNVDKKRRERERLGKLLGL